MNIKVAKTVNEHFAWEEMTRYERLAATIEESIRNGIWLAGEKLPSIRAMSRAENVSPATVVEAYELLRSRGVIEAKDRSGFYVASVSVPLLSVPKVAPGFVKPVSFAADDLIYALRQAAHDLRVFPFGAATPLPDFYPNKAVARCIAQVMRDEPAIIGEYRFPPGSLELRQQLAKRYSAMGVRAIADAYVTTAGAIDALGMALSSVAAPGEVVAVETPGYFGILQLVRSLGYKILEIPLDAERGLTPDRFEKAWQKSNGKIKALITVANYSNPLGTLVSDEDKKALVKLAQEYGVVIIEDDVYGDLGFNGVRPLPLKTFDNDDTVILCGSFSKSISPALRVGYACSKKYASDIILHKTARSSGVSALMEDALALYLKSGNYERHLRKLRRDYQTLIAQYTQSILSLFPSGTRVSRPEGGFILWVQLPKNVDSRVLQARALEKNISIAPGSIFSLSHNDYASFMRINCAIPWSSQAQKALGVLAKLVKDMV